MLLLRYFELPKFDIFLAHLIPFSFLFIVWVVVFFIAGLYEKHTVIFKSRLPNIIFNTQITNSIIAVLFFYFIPYFGITPKTSLFIYLIVSFGLITVWRLYFYPNIGTRRKQKALLIGTGSEMKELRDEVNHNLRYGLEFTSSIDLNEVSSLDFQEDILNKIYSENISIIVADLHNEKVGPLLPHLYNLIFSNIQFIQTYKVYEDIFDRVPLSLLKYDWFIENISLSPKLVFDFLKRVMDITFSFVLGLFTILISPFVILAIKLDDGGRILSFQDRVGKNNKLVKLVKFRTMSYDDGGVWGSDDLNKQKNKVTKIGKFLRKSRIDELPQLWNVLRGDISLIGPRPEFPEPVKEYSEKIPFYNVRHVIKPGLSGWAQIYHENHPHHGIDIDETRNKLSYDLYYIKNRSFILDLKIALKTINELLSRKGQ